MRACVRACVHARAPRHGDPPIVLGDGMNLWEQLSGTKPWSSSPRTELLHEAHPEDDAEAAQGNGHALRVGDLKVVLRSGSSWSTGSHIGSNDGWFGGVLSSDRKHDGYVFPQSSAPHATPTTACGPTPHYADWALQFGNESLYACESRIGLGNNASACLFNISADPCEYYDLSRQEPQLLASMLSRLNAYRATAVDANFKANPDPGCPTTMHFECADCPGGWGKANTPCANNHPIGPPPPPPPPPSPIPPGSFMLMNGGKHCVVADSEAGAAGLSVRTCEQGKAAVWAIDLAVGPGWLVSGGQPEGYLKLNTVGAKTPGDVCTTSGDVKLGAETRTSGMRHQGFTFDNATGTILLSPTSTESMTLLSMVL